jgi:antirestriction protein
MTEQMPIIITISDDVQEKINELKEENFYEGDMIEFIQEHGNDAFLAHYEDYVHQGENHGYEAVDAFVDEFGIQCVEHFEDAYVGQYDSEEQFAQQYVDEMYNLNLDDCPVVVDWEKTWNCNLCYDFSFNDGYVFRSNF